MGRIHRLYELLEARAWDDLGGMLAAKVVYEIPQTRERISGREAYLEFNRTFPGDWHVAVLRAVDDGEGAAAAWVRATVEGTDVDNLAFLSFGPDGLVTAIADFWPESYEPPERRVPTERY